MRMLSLMMLAAFLFSCQPQEPATDTTVETEETLAPPARDGVVIHISHGADNPHKLLMGLKMALNMAPDQDVLIYMDTEAVKAAVKTAEPIEMKPFGNHMDMLTAIYDYGIEVMVCPTCLEIAGYSEEDLREGTRLGTRETFFTFTEGRILTLDY